MTRERRTYGATPGMSTLLPKWVEHELALADITPTLMRGPTAVLAEQELWAAVLTQALIDALPGSACMPCERAEAEVFLSNHDGALGAICGVLGIDVSYFRRIAAAAVRVPRTKRILTRYVRAA